MQLQARIIRQPGHRPNVFFTRSIGKLLTAELDLHASERPRLVLGPEAQLVEQGGRMELRQQGCPALELGEAIDEGLLPALQQALKEQGWWARWRLGEKLAMLIPAREGELRPTGFEISLRGENVYGPTNLVPLVSVWKMDSGPQIPFEGTEEYLILVVSPVNSFMNFLIS